MRYRLIILLSMLCGQEVQCQSSEDGPHESQENTVNLSRSDFNLLQLAELSTKDNWLFSPGSDTAMAGVTWNTSGWKRINPHHIEQFADDNGRIEGWFRITVKLDSSIEGIPLFITYRSVGQAVDLFADGHFLESFGNTGSRGGSYKRIGFQPYESVVPFDFQPGREHLFAFHYVLEPAGFPIDLLTTDAHLFFNFGVAGPSFEPTRARTYSSARFWSTVICAVCWVLTFLFLLIYFQYHSERILRLILFSSINYSLMGLFYLLITEYVLTSYPAMILYNLWISMGVGLVLLFITLIFSQVFTHKLPSRLWLVGILAILLTYGLHFNDPLLVGAIILIYIGLSCYYVLSSWKKVRGAQWAVVAGFMATLVAILVFFLVLVLFPVWAQANSLVFVSIILLSFPLSLLVYVSMRFKEMITEVRDQSGKVLALTEEKRQQAVNQQVVLEEQVKERTADLSRSLEQLKSTQSQLIQSEKMASLGELTAGIAHEIQNPLNFVNNFSEVNSELISELKGAVEKGNLNEVRSIATTIEENESKIVSHGKRADAIVKSMLQHSRKSTGQKEPTDINALCDEYLRLSYHGLRAKDKSFNAKFETAFDPSVGQISVLPQEIGRVILNLINNAFYAVSEKKKLNLNNYEPTVIVTTKKTEKNIEVRVSDNGIGIPQKVLDKIFNPFFTTKPTGQGTGLGLSLSYDIITKGHGGQLKVETTEGSGSEFTLVLPLG